jgi:hypothetical protein
MPREDRRIIFDMSETYQALYRLSLKKEDENTIKPGAIVNVEINKNNEDKFDFHLKNPQDEIDEIMTFSKDFVAAALMMFCRGAGIPLPKRAQKSVMIREGQMILRVVV